MRPLFVFKQSHDLWILRFYVKNGGAIADHGRRRQYQPIEFEEGTNESGNDDLGSNARVHAPAKFLGDWVSMEVVEITYQANIFQTGNFVRKAPYRVSISGPGGEATWYGPAVEPSTTWKFLSVPVEEADAFLTIPNPFRQCAMALLNIDCVI